MLTKQEIFTKVKNHLLQQNTKSAEEEICKYRHGSLACAVGCLIEDEFYSPKLEYQSVKFAFRNRFFITKATALNQALSKSGIDVYDETIQKLLMELQHLHDSHQPQNWPIELEKLAEKYNVI